MPVHCLPMIMAKVSNEQRKEKVVKRQDWKGKKRAPSQLLDQTFGSVGCCHHQSTGRKGKGTEFIKVRSSESACNAGDPGSIPGSGRSSGEGIGYPFQYSWASLVLSWLRIRPQCGRPGFDPWVGKTSWRRERQPTPVFCPGEFHGLQSMDSIVHGVAKSQTLLSSRSHRDSELL